MAKLTLDERISKVNENITKEELSIEESKEKLKKLKAELKALKAEKEQSFANEILKLMKSKGISHEELMNQLKSTESQIPNDTFSSPNEKISSDTSEEKSTDFSTSNNSPTGENSSI